MLAATLLVLALSHAPTGRWHRVGPLEVNVPVEWARVEQSGSAARFEFFGIGYAIFDVETVTPPLDKKACRDRILAKFPDGRDWREKVFGDFLGASQIRGEWAVNVTQFRTDSNREQLRDGHSNYQKILRTARYVGCDGRFAWSMVFESSTDADEQEYVIDGIARAVENVRVAKGVMLGTASAPSATPSRWHEVGPLQVRLPTDWVPSDEPGSVARFNRKGVGYMIVDASVVKRPQKSASSCRDKILSAMPDGVEWKREHFGVFSGASHVAVDETEGDEAIAERARTARYVGCDGKHTWSLTVVSRTDAKDAAEALGTVDLALKSIRCGTPEKVSSFRP